MADNDNRVVEIEWTVTMRMVKSDTKPTEWEFDLPNMALSRGAAANLVASFAWAIRDITCD